MTAAASTSAPVVASTACPGSGTGTFGNVIVFPSPSRVVSWTPGIGTSFSSMTTIARISIVSAKSATTSASQPLGTPKPTAATSERR